MCSMYNQDPTPVVTLSAALSPAMSHLSKLLDSLCRAFIRVPVEGSNWAVERTYYSNNACLLNRPVNLPCCFLIACCVGVGPCMQAS